MVTFLTGLGLLCCGMALGMYARKPEEPEDVAINRARGFTILGALFIAFAIAWRVGH